MAPPHCRRRLAAAVLGGALACGLAACGSSGANSPTSSTAKPTGTTQPTSGAGAGSAVRHAYETLFDLANPAVAPKVASVQDGPALRATLAAELKSPLAKEAAGATVSAVGVKTGSACADEGLPSPCASVTYSILSPTKKPLVANSKGWATYVSGRWVVAKETICGLLALAGGTPAGC